ncbi:hypothetical protein TNCV_362511 [Trichonephila clavipes]|nr:hypothetical protein TNCV_362511 [Trichonephila clavipes]
MVSPERHLRRHLTLQTSTPHQSRRNPYQQLTEFEGARIIGLRGGGLPYHDIAKRFGRNVFAGHDCWEQRSRNGTVSF